MTVLSLASILAESARRYRDKVAVVDGDARVSYTQLWREARAFAAGLRDAGVRAGDHVALMAPNTADSGAKVLVCHTNLLTLGTPAAEFASVPVVTIGPLSSTVDGLSLDPAADPVPSFVSRQAEDPAVILYTSGTTGQPKGAVLTNLNLVMNAIVNTVEANDARSEDVVLGCLPLFHSFGQTVSMNGTLRLGATLVMLPRFTGAAAIDLMIKEKVDVFHGVPTMYIGLLDAAAGYEQLPRLRLCISGGASLPLAVLEKWVRAVRDLTHRDHQPTSSANCAAR